MHGDEGARLTVAFLAGSAYTARRSEWGHPPMADAEILRAAKSREMQMPPEQDETAQPDEWTVRGFLDEFMRINDHMLDRSFAFVLGSGASVSSGIPTGGSLVKRWIDELYTRHVDDAGSRPLEEWVASGGIGIKGLTLDNAASLYSQVYERRFADDKDSGFAYLENEMRRAEPSIGYSVLAQILDKTRHQVVITTNFDNLVADALSIYTNTFPLVCGHESLAGFVRPKLTRPLVAKIHRDLLLEPKSDPDGTATIGQQWARVLRRLFSDYTPIFIGYGGNDGSLMGFLEALGEDHIPGGAFWCYRGADGQPDDRICALVAKHGGKLVPIVGFDEIMIQLGERLKYPPLADRIEEQAKKRAERYRKQFEEFQENLAKEPERAEEEEAVEQVREALDETLRRIPGWWAWALRARVEEDPDKREAIYREGLRVFPRSAELHDSLAVFMTSVRKDHDEAEHLFRRAMELGPEGASITGNFAGFTHTVRRDYDEAERLYRHALQLDPEHANNTGNLCGFLLAQGRIEEARPLMARAWELSAGRSPGLAVEVGLYWCLSEQMQGREDAAGLARLKWLLAHGYERDFWSLDDVLAGAAEKIPPEDMPFYTALAAAILDETKVAELQSFDRWQQIEPIPIDEPWDMEAGSQGS